jgi:hypothetical protein
MDPQQRLNLAAAFRVIPARSIQICLPRLLALLFECLTEYLFDLIERLHFCAPSRFPSTYQCGNRAVIPTRLSENLLENAPTTPEPDRQDMSMESR